jgi:hypothetical protein
MREYVAKRGWTVAMQVKEVGSGASERELREKLLEAARRREIDVVLVWRLERWGRSVADLVATLQELSHLGVGFVSLVVLLFTHAFRSHRRERLPAQIAAQLFQRIDRRFDGRLAFHPYQQSGIVQRVHLATLTLRAPIPVVQREGCGTSTRRAPRYASAPLRPWPTAGPFEAAGFRFLGLPSMPACSSTASVFSVRA